MDTEVPAGESGPYQATGRTTLRRHPEGADYDRDVVHAILDEALVGHLGVTTPEGPRVLPTAFVRADETVSLPGRWPTGPTERPLVRPCASP